MNMISAVVVTFNEGDLLDSCLESVYKFCEEILIVDLGSSDNTQDVAKKYKAKFITHEKVDYVELIRDFATSKVSGEWVLVLDPDERITPILWGRLNAIVNQDQYVAVNIPRKNIFFGKWVRHSNWWPDRHIRFFKKDKIKWNEKIHSYPDVDGQILNLEAREDLAINHFGYDSIKQFFERQNRYSTIEAQNKFEQGERFSFFNMIWKPLREFLVRFIKHLGFLDGFVGISLVYLMMIYQLSILVKLWEMEQKDK